MPIKPANLTYGVDETPPNWVSGFLGFQHLCIVSIAFIFPVIIVNQAGGTLEEADTLVSMSMLAGGIGVILQALKRGPIGSGYLCPQVCGPSFLSASILAAKTGGISLLLGMTVVAGVTEGIFSRFIHRLRFLFPAEVTGLIVAMVGLTVVKVAMGYFLGLGPDDTEIYREEVLVSVLTLATMVGLNVWSKGKLKLFCILIGMGMGYFLSWLFGLMGADSLEHIQHSSWVSFPLLNHPGWSFDIAMLGPVIVATLCSSLKTVGDITTCQKINDAEWKRPDMQNMRGGILADGLGCLSSGLLGGMGQSSSSTNIGLSIATGATSRVIAFVLGGMLMALAFLPKAAAVFTIMPRPVMGATLVFALSFMVVAGIQIVMSRMLDARKTFVMGLSLIFGLSVDLVPQAYAGMHPWIQPLFSSSLSAGAVSAVVLNLIFRIGISQKEVLELTPGASTSRDIFDFLERQGGAWGARREVVQNAITALTELWEAIDGLGMAKGTVKLEARFDELSLDFKVAYKGEACQLPDQPPGQEELISDPKAQAALAGYLVRRYVDSVKESTSGDSCLYRLHFEH
jgi:xanthine permease XanP